MSDDREECGTQGPMYWPQSFTGDDKAAIQALLSRGMTVLTPDGSAQLEKTILDLRMELRDTQARLYEARAEGDTLRKQVDTLQKLMPGSRP